MKYALIENNIAIHVLRVNPYSIIFPHHAELYIDAPDDVEQGWTFINGVWSAPVVDYTFIRRRKIADIKLDRDNRKSLGVLVQGKWFHTDTNSRIQYIGLVNLGVTVPNISWKTMDKTFILMNQSLIIEIVQAVTKLDILLFNCAEENISLLAALSNDKVETFQSTGWPQNYYDISH